MERIITKSFARLMGRGTHRGFITYEELSKSLGKRNLSDENLSQAFIHILEERVALVEKKHLNFGFMVFCHVKLAQHTETNISDFEAGVSQLDEVLECYHVSGEFDYLLKVMVKDMDAFRLFMTSKLTSLRHIGSTQSSFTINEVKNTTALKVSRNFN